MAEILDYTLGLDGNPLIEGSSNDPAAVAAAAAAGSGSTNNKTFWDYFDINKAFNSSLNFVLGMWGDPQAQATFSAATTGTSGTAGTGSGTADGFKTGLAAIPWSSLALTGAVIMGGVALIKHLGRKKGSSHKHYKRRRNYGR
jgi:hypothetical protein